MTPTVAVLGGGIAGLAAAWELSGGGARARPDCPAVVLFEASGALGGKLATSELGGTAVDVGPDGFLGRRPEAVELCREVGLADELVPVGRSGAEVWARGRRRRLPEGLVLGVPTRVVPAARSGILSPRAVVRLATDLVFPRPDTRGPLGDRAIGPLVARKLGPEVVARLVDPLVGGIHAGGVSDASAAAVFPALLEAAQQRASLMRSLARLSRPGPRPDAEPAFWALRCGFGSLVARLAELLGARGVEVRLGEPAESIERAGTRWVVAAGGGARSVDAVVLATPAGATAALLEPHDAEAASLLRNVDYASVAVVTMLVPEDALPEDLFGTGVLVPRATPVPGTVAHEARARRREPCMVTACTYLWAKWPHLERPGVRLLRASVGRMGDARHRSMDDGELVRRVAEELQGLVGLAAEPLETAVTRWDEALPQYRVHHLLRVAAVEAAVQRLGGLAVAGAAYRGVGIPACIGSGRSAAAAVTASLAGSPSTASA